VGRTNPTYRDRLDALEGEWESYRRALRAREQGAYDRLFEHVRAYAHAAAQQNHATPEFPTLVSMLLAHERQLAIHDRRVERLDERLADLEKRVEAVENDAVHD